MFLVSNGRLRRNDAGSALLTQLWRQPPRSDETRIGQGMLSGTLQVCESVISCAVKRLEPRRNDQLVSAEGNIR